MSNLQFLAGPGALARIREEGLDPAQVSLVAGAAGGPKALVLAGLDRAIFGGWLTERSDPVFLVGASIGAWRFAAVAQPDSLAALERFHRAYVAQSYSRKPTPAEVSAEGRRIMDQYLDDNAIQGILTHPFLRLSLLAARYRWPLVGPGRLSLTAGLAAAFFANAAHRRLLVIFFERTLFHDPRDPTPFGGRTGLALQAVGLDPENFRNALLSSGSIPLVMEGVTDIRGARPSTYFDGGLVDYHLDLPFPRAVSGLTLYPHYTDRVVPGWLDKQLPWRGPDPAHLDNVLLLTPSPGLVASLPGGKIPDRKDFHRFAGRDAERQRVWRQVIQTSQCLGDEFLEAVSSGRIRGLVRPLFGQRK